MIRHGFDITKLGEIARVSVRGRARCKVNVLAEDFSSSNNGVIEVRRGYTHGAPVKPYSTPVTLPLDGSAPAELTVEDCIELVLVVTTVGLGRVQIDYETYGAVFDTLELVEGVKLDSDGPAASWRSHPLGTSITIVGKTMLSNTSVVDVRELISRGSNADELTGQSFDPDGGMLTLDRAPGYGLQLYTTTPQDDQSVDLWIYSCQTAVSAGLRDQYADDYARLSIAQAFAENQSFPGVILGTPSTGYTTITTSSTTNKAVTFPDVEGEIAVVNGGASSDEYIKRSGNGWEATDELLAGDGSSSNVSIGFVGDPDSGLWRTGSDNYGLAVGGFEVIDLSTQFGGLVSVVAIEAGIFSISATFTWSVVAPDVQVFSDDSTLGGILSIYEGTDNGNGAIGLKCPDLLAVGDVVDYELPVKPDGDNSVLHGDLDGSTRWEEKSGTAFPSPAYDGQEFRRTDLNNEKFYYDGGRSKWLGTDLRSWEFGRDVTSTSSFWTMVEGRVTMTDSHGWHIPYDITIVEVIGSSIQSFTGDLDLHNGATKDTTLGSWSSSTHMHATGLNYDVNGGATVDRKAEIANITSGTAEDPIGEIFYRRRAT